MSVAWQEDIIKLAKCQMNAKEFFEKYKEITIEEAKIMKILMEKSAK